MSEADWFERQYMPSLTVADAVSFLPLWAQRAAETRRKFPFVADIRYGSHPREVLDYFQAEDARGCVVFIHGGYWVEFSKTETSWIADGFLGQGLSVVLVNYPLAPQVTINDIRVSCLRAFAHAYTQVLSPIEREAVVVAGHSAGGYLAASHLTQDWTMCGLPAQPFAGVLTLSGVFDLIPLMNTSLQTVLQLSPQDAERWNLTSALPRTQVPLVLAVGAKESEEFHRQTGSLAHAWTELRPHAIEIAEANHFTILDSLATPGAVLNRLAVACAQR
jgi:arylformamidase